MKSAPKEVREYHSSSAGLFFKVEKRLHSEESPFQKIEIFENGTFGKVLFLDGLVQTSEGDEFFYHEMLVHPAFVSHPAPKTCLIIGGGDGGTLKEVLHYPLDYACLVEIDPEVIKVCQKFFPWLDETLRDERAELVVADGEKFINTTEQKYDIVLIDSSEPVGPSSILHEQKFYVKLKQRLNPGGIVVAQVGSPFYHLGFLKKKAGLLKKIYSVVHFYLGPVPTYPGGTWCYAFLSNDIQPDDVKGTPPPGLKYYNLAIHRGAFALPGFMDDLSANQ
jgi:spermidine synthase